MIFGRKKSWEDTYDEGYVQRTDRLERAAKRSTVWIHCLGFVVATALVIAVVGLIAGQMMVEKTLTGLASPAGIVWLGLLAMIYFGFMFRNGITAVAALCCWAILTIFGNGYISNQLMCSLENDYFETDLEQLPKFEVGFILGGGTTTTVFGQEQINAGGDRVVTAAMLYHAEKFNRLVCTGQHWNRTHEQDMHPYEEASRLLARLDVPEDKIAKISGRNTSEEMENIVKFLAQEDLNGAPIAIITSSFHLNRAERLARKNGLDPTMIPCDFKSVLYSPGPDLLLPTGHNLDKSAIVIKEYLAGLIGR